MIPSAQSQDDMLVLREQLPMRRPYMAPRTPTEARLAEIWRKVLGMDQVGVDDAYRDLGGDSLLASIIFALISEAFEVTAQMSMLIEAPTVAQLAEKLDRLVGAA
jgi:acyl carrier protein